MKNFCSFFNNNRITGAVIAALSVWIYIQSAGIENMFNEAIGPGDFPKFVSIVMFILGSLLCVLPDDVIIKIQKSVIIRQLILLAILIFFALTIKPIGFIPSAVLTLIALIKLFGGNWKQSLIFGISLAIGIYLLFEYALQIPLPDMPFLGKDD